MVGVPLLYLGGALLIDELVLSHSGAAGAALLAAGVVVKLAALAYAWVFVLTACRDERAKLAARWARLRFVADAFKLEDGDDNQAAAAAVTAAAARAVPSSRGARSATAAMPASLATSASIISTHADVAEGEAAAAFGPERAKERLLSGFARATAAYVAVVALAALAAAFWDAAFGLASAIQDAAEWTFMAALTWIFRPRPEKCARAHLWQATTHRAVLTHMFYYAARICCLWMSTASTTTCTRRTGAPRRRTSCRQPCHCAPCLPRRRLRLRLRRRRMTRQCRRRGVMRRASPLRRLRLRLRLRRRSRRPRPRRARRS